MKAHTGIILVGRTNREKRSDMFPRIAAILQDRGFTVESFTSDHARESERINQRLARFFPAIEASLEPHHPFHRRMLRFFLKGILVLCGKQRWRFIRALLQPAPFTTAQDLDRFLERCPFDRVHLIAHSAGGIAATKVSANPKVAGICCFGYPFKHPQRPPESYRTRHLAKVTKPLLIVQGRSDEYGPPSPELEAMLPPQAWIIASDCDHDYASMREVELEQVVAAMGLS